MICDESAVGCRGICPEFGWPCNRVVIGPCNRVVIDGITTQAIPLTSVCDLGVCAR